MRFMGVVLGLIVLSALAAACGTSSSGSSSGASPEAGGPALDAICHPASELTLASYRPRAITGGGPEGAPTHRRHVKVGSCEGYLFYWVDEAAQRFDDWLVTNCAPPALGGPAVQNGFPQDCMLDVTGTNQPDSPPRIYYEISCVCCDGTQCGRYCHPVDLPGGGGVKCASYSYDFKSSVIADDPTTDPEHCDCTTE